MKFLKNAWYMAAWSEEIGASLLRRRILGRAIVLYRLENGRVAALDDRCPHRFLPLSRGERQGDTIRRGYHGSSRASGIHALSFSARSIRFRSVPS